jgi:hypothetical protein
MAVGAAPNSPALAAWCPWGPRRPCRAHDTGSTAPAHAGRNIVCACVLRCVCQFSLVLFDQQLLQNFELKRPK